MCSLFKIIFCKFWIKYNSNILLKCSKTKMGDVYTPYMSWLEFVHATPTMLYTRLYFSLIYTRKLFRQVLISPTDAGVQINKKKREKKKPTTKKKTPKRVRIFPCMHKFLMSKVKNTLCIEVNIFTWKIVKVVKCSEDIQHPIFI